MELLLQAAKVLELENSGVGADRVSSKSTRGNHLHQYAKSKGDNSENSDGSLSYGENGVGGDEDVPLVERTSRRVGGAGTREVHNQLEKNRRKQLRECFNHLQQCVPSLENKRVATQSILQGAIKHIKNLKKKDVEQEREIQMLAKRKSELKKKYDIEFNKCTEEQHRTAEAILKVIKAETEEIPQEDDGNASDSTNTASEGPDDDDFSDDERDTAAVDKSTTFESKLEGQRKRKLSGRSVSGYEDSMNEMSPSGQGAGMFVQQLSSKAGATTSSVSSSSSVALKHMLEQRKRNQNMAAHDNSRMRSSSSSAKSPSKAASSLTSSYPMISTHLASALKPNVSSTSHIVGTQASQVIAQSPVSATASSSCKPHAVTTPNIVKSSASSSSLPPPAPATDKGRKTGDSSGGSSKVVNTPSPQRTVSMYVAPSPTSQIVSSGASSLPPKSPVKTPQSPVVFPSGITLMRQANTVTMKTPDAIKFDSPLTLPPKTISAVPGMDVQTVNYLGKNVIGSGTGATISMQSLSSGTQTFGTVSSKVLPTVIPVSLTSLIRSLPVSPGMNPVVSLASPQLTLSSAGTNPTTSVVDMTTTSLLTNKLQPTLGANLLLTTPIKTEPGGNLLLTTPVKTEPGVITAVPFSNQNARIATLLAAPSTHINNSMIRPTSPINNTAATTFHSPSVSAASPSISIPDSYKTVTLTPTILPLPLTNGQIATSSSTAISPGTPLRIFTPLSHNSVVGASLTNGQTPLLPTVVQLGTSGQVALLQNLIPTQHVQVQNPHQLLAQPIVVMTTPGSSFSTASATGTGTITTISTSSSIV